MRTTKYFTRAVMAAGLILALAQTATLATAAEVLGMWQKRMPITFGGYTPGRETLTNFPVLVILSNTIAGVGFNYSDFLSPPYGDLRFAAADKTTPLDFEVESWNVSGLSHVWVRVPELTNNLLIYALWGRGGVNAPACTTNGAVWSSTHLGVWHLNGDERDATSNRNNGVNHGSTNSAGIVANGHGFNGSATYVDMPANLRGLGVTNAFAILCWFRQGVTSAGMLMEDGTAFNTDAIYLGLASANQLFVRLNTVTVPAGVYNDTVAVGAMGTNWHAIAYVYDGAAVRLYYDAVQVWTAGISGTIANGNTHMQFGCRPNGASLFLSGLMDEVRIENVTRSTNWIWGCYMSTASNGVFNAYGAPENQGGSPLVSNVSAVVTASYVTLNGFLVSTGQDANVSAAVFWGTNDAGANMAGWTCTNRFPGWTAEGPLSTNVTPGLTGARYYCRFFASNSFGEAWASPAGNFIALGPPGINNGDGATNLTLFSATMQGSVTGGDPTPGVWIYWGTVNRGTNKALWEHETAIGVASNWTFSATVGGLTPGTTYYYTCYASNSYGEAWASVTNFTSLGAVRATGGNTTNDIGGFRIHAFTSSGMLTVTAGGVAEVLVVGGGGGGGSTGAGGGGAGGLVYYPTNFSLISGVYTVVVGAGGPSDGYGLNSMFSNSASSLIVAAGGGRGGPLGDVGGAGGSGGGGGGVLAAPAKAGGAGVPTGQGNAGGAGGVLAGNWGGGGGGGGSGAVGAIGQNNSNGGDGGVGLQFPQFIGLVAGATNGYFAGGGGGGEVNGSIAGKGGAGGGGNANINLAGTAGTNNTGGGGGGGAWTGSVGLPGGAGGSGIVIVRYPWGAPSVSNAGAVVTESYVTLNGVMVSTGQDANVSAGVFWGTNDAGASMAGWTCTNRFPGWSAEGPLSTNVTPGQAGAKYYFRFFASNCFGHVLASPAGTFSSTGAPSVNNAGGATDVGAASATLQGEITGGNPAPFAWFYWGTVNRGTSKALWEHATAVGIVSNWTFTSAIAGLTPSVTYYYSCYASNIHGDAWATVSNFTCLGGVLRTWDGGGADNNASTPANWSPDAAPGPGDDIILNTTSHKNMTWNMTNMPVGSWRQIGYLGTVTVATVYGPTGFTNFNIIGNCTISNGLWTHVANPAGTYYEVNRLNVTVGGNLVVGANAAINVLGKGYAAQGCGPGRYADTGSHGGRGHNGGANAWCYDSVVAPVNLGAGGWSWPGGGAIILSVAGEMRHDGLLCANGGGGYAYYGGAGGTINIQSGTLVGTGAIQANAGNLGGLAHSGGGGGRIALVVTNFGADLAGYMGLPTAYGIAQGGAGTIYLRTAAQAAHEGTLIVDNNINPVEATEIGTHVTDAEVGNVVIRNKGYLMVQSDTTLTLSGTWSNGANYAGQAGSQVIFAGPAASTSIVYGSSSFKGLTCTNTGGKTILFEAGKTSTVSAMGRLVLKGSASATNLFLRSTSDGTPWLLKIDPTADQSIMRVDVRNSDARPGAIAVGIDSMDRGGNFNWSFTHASSGETNTWTGDTNTVWSAAPNWDLARPPLADDFIVIPSGRPRYPALDNDRTVNGIDIRSGASLALAGYDFTVRKAATVAGLIVASATETITFQTNVDFTGGSFTAARSTIALDGAGSQSANLSAQAFHAVNVLNTNTVTFDGGFSATELRCEAASGERRMQFQPGATVMLRDFTMLGSTASTNIVLRSSSVGQKWNLAVSGNRWNVRGVDVRDSDASFGLPIPAEHSKDSGNNLNWYFNVTQSVWLGTSGSSFDTPANWLSGAVPGANSRVLVAATNPLAIVNPVTLLDLTVGGGIGRASVAAYATLTVNENILVLTNGTLSLNQPSVVRNGLYVQGGGILTHNGPQATEAYKLDVTVYGNVGVDVNAAVNVTAKGYEKGKGPGAGTGASHGGRGSDGYAGGIPANGPCYGSITAPTNLGSGGGWYAGGGAIRMRVFGTIRNDGVMLANGLENDYCIGSGGSVFLTAGRLIGIGTIQANGGNAWGHSAGGGGRVSLVLTNSDFSGFTGLVQARSSPLTGGGAGTVHLKRASDRRGYGTVIINNSGLSSSGYTEVPPGPPGNIANETEFLTFHITNAARMKLTNDYLIGDIFLQSANVQLNLNSKTLTVRSKEHPLGSGSVANYGAIVWWPYFPHGTIFRAK